MNPLDRLHLDYHGVLNKQIQFEFSCDPLSLVLEPDPALVLDSKALCSQFDDEAVAIDRLEQSWPESTVDGDHAADYSLSQRLNLLIW